ncbi:MAG: NAD(P)/FAD-dependent oxidoreductase [Minisyncoccia bacterium]
MNLTPKKIYDAIIIGGGPAGITAGIYLARKKVLTLLITRDFVGQVGKTGIIDNYPGLPGIQGMDLMKRFKEHLQKFEIEILEGEVVTKLKKKDKVFEAITFNKKNFFGKTILVTTGGEYRKLGIEGEKEFIGKGVSYCPICDAPFFKEKQVVVVGGGNSGFEAALELSKYARKVYLFVRTNKIKADEVLQEEVKKNSKIEVMINTELKKIEGKDNVQAVIFEDLANKKIYQMPCSGVFIQIGVVPATDFLKRVCKFNKNKEVKINPKTFQTSVPGIFAAGDVNSGKYKQIIIAAGEGASAALSIYEYLQEKFRPKI